ncbi:hypothetical protein HYC85_024350 [Camellia sinensis]|uniref:Uncharacterized protein n=1 Tax=Camellia sinensis TaxID=4442 RepID=A0A7J7GBQ5_CAMSI|nr:hypothetical protein HYC85_024350 [Camellia sinensis]
MPPLEASDAICPSVSTQITITESMMQSSSSIFDVGNRIIRKRIHVRIEHVQPSRCIKDFKLRKKNNDKLKAKAKARSDVISTKRQREGPKPDFMVEGATLEIGTDPGL